MAKYHGGQFVKDGYYWSGFKGQLVAIDGEGGFLSGEQTTKWWRIPVILMIPFGLFLGGAYVIFLPFAGFAMVLGFLGVKAWEGLLWLGYNLLKACAPSLAPGEAFFARFKKGSKEIPLCQEEEPPNEEETKDRLKELEQEITERRITPAEK